MEFPEQEFTPKRDRYSKRRGAPKFLDLSCLACDEPVAVYQKDGPGKLLRLYADRIVWPPELIASHGQVDASNIKAAGNIACQACETVVAMPTVYQAEHRAAYNVRRDFLLARPHQPNR